YTVIASSVYYTSSLHDALPIYRIKRAQPPELPPAVDRAGRDGLEGQRPAGGLPRRFEGAEAIPTADVIGGIDQREGLHPVLLDRSEEHTSELQSLAYLVCRLLL